MSQCSPRGHQSLPKRELRPLTLAAPHKPFQIWDAWFCPYLHQGHTLLFAENLSIRSVSCLQHRAGFCFTVEVWLVSFTQTPKVTFSYVLLSKASYMTEPRFKGGEVNSTLQEKLKNACGSLDKEWYLLQACVRAKHREWKRGRRLWADSPWRNCCRETFFQLCSTEILFQGFLKNPCMY